MDIKVKATANVKKLPDCMRLSITVLGRDKDKQIAIKKLNANEERVKQYLQMELGIDFADVVTSRLEINEEWQNRQIKSGNMFSNTTETERVFVGYKVSHYLTAETELDVEKGVKATLKLAEKDEVYVDVGYFIKNMDEFQEQAMTEALRIAGEKASVVARSFDPDAMPKCIEVDYTHYDHNARSMCTMDMACLAEDDYGDFDEAVESITQNINLSEITISESVSTVWAV